MFALDGAIIHTVRGRIGTVEGTVITSLLGMILEQNQELFLAIQLPPGSQAFWVLDVMLLTYVKVLWI